MRRNAASAALCLDRDARFQHRDHVLQRLQSLRRDPEGGRAADAHYEGADAVPFVDRLSTEPIKSIQDPENRTKLAAQGIEPGGMTPTKLAAFQKSEVEK
jgi:hypothetical protein